ncbi:MAG: hypothetical protein ACQER7_12155 [Bacteroidota bacterium]
MTTTFEIHAIDSDNGRIHKGYEQKLEKLKADQARDIENMSKTEMWAAMDITDEELYYQCLLEIRNEDQSSIWEGFPANTPDLEKELTDERFLGYKGLVK